VCVKEIKKPCYCTELVGKYKKITELLPAGIAAMKIVKGPLNNLVPLPYSRIAVQIASFDLDEAEIREFLRGKEVWFETDYVVFRHGNQCAIARIEKTAPTDLFSPPSRLPPAPSRIGSIEGC
jgi:hypothetical protein